MQCYPYRPYPNDMTTLLLCRPLLDNVHRAKGPWFVAGKDMETNTLFITNHYDELTCASRRTFEVKGINWISGSIPTSLQGGDTAELQVRGLMLPTTLEA